MIVVGLLVGVAVLAIRAQDGLPLRDYQTVHLDMPAVGNLRVHDEVTIAGTRVGQVSELRIGADGRARVALQLDPSVEPLSRDTAVEVRAAGLLGARSVELVPGQSDDVLGEGSTIRASRDALTFGVADAIDTFDADTRGRLGETVRGLGDGTLGRGEELNGAIHAASRAQKPLQGAVDSVLSRPGAARRLLPSLEQLATTTATARQDLARLLPATADALDPLAESRTNLQKILDQAPPTLQAANAGLLRGRELLVATRVLAGAVSDTLPGSRTGLRATTRLLRESPEPLRRTESLLRAAAPAVPSALDITSALSPLLDPLRSGLDDATPIVRRLGKFGCDIRNLGAVFRSVTGLSSTPGGEVGAMGQLRLQFVASPFEVLGSEDPLITRDGYSPPCTYTSTEYPAVALGGVAP